jgi:hypothetical protein
MNPGKLSCQRGWKIGDGNLLGRSTTVRCRLPAWPTDLTESARGAERYSPGSSDPFPFGSRCTALRSMQTPMIGLMPARRENRRDFLAPLFIRLLVNDGHEPSAVAASGEMARLDRRRWPSRCPFYMAEMHSCKPNVGERQCTTTDETSGIRTIFSARPDIV